MIIKKYVDFINEKMGVPDNIITSATNLYNLILSDFEKRSEDDFSETLALINKYKAAEASLKRAEYFVNVSYDALGIFPDNEDKKILQNPKQINFFNFRLFFKFNTLILFS